MKNYNWGIIGLGNIANTFARGLSFIPNARVFAVASRSLEKAISFAQKYDAPFAYGSYEEMMQNPDINIIYIATPHALHYENTMMCLDHGFPVLCEKAFAINAREVKEMVDKSRTKKVFLMEAFWTRFLPSMHILMDLINSNTIGEIKLVRADFGIKGAVDPKNRLYDNNLGGGSLLDVGIYPVFLALFVLGIPDNIEAVATIGKTQVDENCGMLFHYKDGPVASLFSSIVARTGIEAEIIGENGRIVLNSLFFCPTSLSIYKDDKLVKTIQPEYYGNGYNYEAVEAMNCLEKNLIESKTMSLDFSIKLIETLDRIRNKCGLYYPLHDKKA
ncbi:MAG: Gfo/Idh/MocA family oxidoreductase [Bacteroidales bacterium]|nr:Gfo/Idh/MocA family oxidoreductase [Bacteroidales bacterium]